MTRKRTIEVFTAGCVCCDEAVATVEEGERGAVGIAAEPVTAGAD